MFKGWSRIVSCFTVASVLFVVGCAAAPEESEIKADEGNVGQTQQAMSTCYDWNGTCSGLPEGAACGSGGTCVPDYSVVGWCFCQEPAPPPPPPPSSCPPGCFMWSGMLTGGGAPRCLCP